MILSITPLYFMPNDILLAEVPAGAQSANHCDTLRIADHGKDGRMLAVKR